MSMMAVKNNWTRPIRIGRDVLKPGCVDTIDESLLYTPRVQRLRKKKRLVFPYKFVEAEGEPKAQAQAAVEPEVLDDLTDLVHIGAGRNRILTEAGITTFQQVIEADLLNILEVSVEQYDEIIVDAKSRL